MEVALFAGGGMGDAMWANCEHVEFQTIKAIKEYNNPRVILYLHTHNDQSIELFKFNPYIDEIKLEVYMDSTVERPISLLESVYDVESFPKNKLPFYLAPHEQMYVDYICKEHPNYVVIHPFAGGEDRTIINWINLNRLVDQIISLGYTPVVIGGNSTRCEKKLIEEFRYERIGLINLVNKVGVRVSAELSRRAKFFIGAESCYMLPAMSSGAKMLLVFRNMVNLHLTPYVTSEFIKKRNAENVIIRKNEVDSIDRFVYRFLNAEMKDLKNNIYRPILCQN